MQKLILFTLTTVLFSLQAAYSQEVFKLGIKQPPPITITLPEAINASIGEVVNPDTLFHVEGGISYNRVWKFWDGVNMQTLDNQMLTLNNKGVLYLTVIDENGCTAIDSITLDVNTNTEHIFVDPENLKSIHVYPNPNNGSFEILISNCQPGYSVQIINSLGIQIFNRILDCSNNEYSGTIMMPTGQAGIYFLLFKQNKKIISTQKVVILNQ